MNYRKGDYVSVSYDGEDLTGKILQIENGTATVQVCLAARRGEKLLIDEITVDLSKLKKLNIKHN